MIGNALLIGGTGFVGPHMRRLLEAKFNVTATGHGDDIGDRGQVSRLIKRTHPDVVVNFASITTVRESFDDPERTYKVGFLGMLNLLSELKEHGFSGRVLNISSSEVYGFPREDQLPISENTPTSPMSPYAVNKIAAETLCQQWGQTETFEIVTARPFTHIGPGQSDRFAISSFARQIAEIMLGMREAVIRVGNLGSTRDLTDVRDVVRAYVVLLERGRSGNIYNVCSGKETLMRSLLDNLIQLSKIDIEVEQDPSLVRQQEQRRILGSFEKLHEETGWEPEISISQTLSDTLAYWLEKLKTNK